MRLAFAVEPLETCWDEWVELGALQWQETEGYRHDQKLAPLLERYNAYDKAGWFIAVTARDGPLMVGNCGVYITPSMHTQDTIATEDNWFLRKEYRRGRNAIEFYKFAEEEVRKRGAIELTVSSKIIDGKPTTGRILEYMGHRQIGIMYSKNLVTTRTVTRPKTDTASVSL